MGNTESGPADPLGETTGTQQVKIGAPVGAATPNPAEAEDKRDSTNGSPSPEGARTVAEPATPSAAAPGVSFDVPMAPAGRGLAIQSIQSIQSIHSSKSNEGVEVHSRPGALFPQRSDDSSTVFGGIREREAQAASSMSLIEASAAVFHLLAEAEAAEDGYVMASADDSSDMSITQRSAAVFRLLEEESKAGKSDTLIHFLETATIVTNLLQEEAAARGQQRQQFDYAKILLAPCDSQSVSKRSAAVFKMLDEAHSTDARSISDRSAACFQLLDEAKTVDANSVSGFSAAVFKLLDDAKSVESLPKEQRTTAVARVLEDAMSISKNESMQYPASPKPILKNSAPPIHTNHFSHPASPGARLAAGHASAASPAGSYTYGTAGFGATGPRFSGMTSNYPSSPVHSAAGSHVSMSERSQNVFKMLDDAISMTGKATGSYPAPVTLPARPRLTVDGNRVQLQVQPPRKPVPEQGREIQTQTLAPRPEPSPVRTQTEARRQAVPIQTQTDPEPTFRPRIIEPTSTPAPERPHPRLTQPYSDRLASPSLNHPYSPPHSPHSPQQQYAAPLYHPSSPYGAAPMAPMMHHPYMTPMMMHNPYMMHAPASPTMMAPHHPYPYYAGAQQRPPAPEMPQTAPPKPQVAPQKPMSAVAPRVEPPQVEKAPVATKEAAPEPESDETVDSTAFEIAVTATFEGPKPKVDRTLLNDSRAVADQILAEAREAMEQKKLEDEKEKSAEEEARQQLAERQRAEYEAIQEAEAAKIRARQLEPAGIKTSSSASVAEGIETKPLNASIYSNKSTAASLGAPDDAITTPASFGDSSPDDAITTPASVNNGAPDDAITTPASFSDSSPDDAITTPASFDNGAPDGSRSIGDAASFGAPALTKSISNAVSFDAPEVTKSISNAASFDAPALSKSATGDEASQVTGCRTKEEDIEVRAAFSADQSEVQPASTSNTDDDENVVAHLASFEEPEPVEPAVPEKKPRSAFEILEDARAIAASGKDGDESVTDQSAAVFKILDNVRSKIIAHDEESKAKSVEEYSATVFKMLEDARSQAASHMENVRSNGGSVTDQSAAVFSILDEARTSIIKAAEEEEAKSLSTESTADQTAAIFQVLSVALDPSVNGEDKRLKKSKKPETRTVEKTFTPAASAISINSSDNVEVSLLARPTYTKTVVEIIPQESASTDEGDDPNAVVEAVRSIMAAASRSVDADELKLSGDQTHILEGMRQSKGYPELRRILSKEEDEEEPEQPVQEEEPEPEEPPKPPTVEELLENLMTQNLEIPEDIDLEFVDNFDRTFNEFVSQNPQFLIKNPDLVHNIRVAKLHKLLDFKKQHDATLQKERRALKSDKKATQQDLSTKLRQASRAKATCETKLQGDLAKIKMSTKKMKAKLMWELVSGNFARTKKQSDMRLKYKMANMGFTCADIIAQIPDGPDGQKVRNSVVAPATAPIKLNEDQLRDLRHFQVSNAFLNAEVTVLQKKLDYQKQAAKKYGWVESVSLRVDRPAMKRLKARFERECGLEN